MTIQFLDALAGSGKTRSLAQYADRIASRGEKVLFVQPSRLLIDKTIETEINPLMPRYSVRAIHGDTTADVVKTISGRINAPPDRHGEIIFLTHEAFMRLPYLKNKANWNLIFDEVPSVERFEAFNIADSHQLITDTIDMQANDIAYGRLSQRNGSNSQLKQIARNKREDQVWAQFSGLANKIESPNWDVFVLQNNYYRFSRNDETRRQMLTHSLLKPSIFNGFKQVIIVSALFKDSILYKLWSRQGVKMQPVHQSLYDSLRYQIHGNGKLITINYVTDYEWSKSLRDRKVCVGDTAEKSSLLTALPGLIRDAHGGRPLAWMGNKDIGDDYFGAADAVRLPNSPHGLNMFHDLHDVVILSALNPPPAHFQFMEAQGISGDELRTAHYRSSAYQAVMRISIRNPSDLSPKTITVMDRSTAEWLANLFPGASIQKLSGQIPVALPGKPGRPRMYASAKERTRACRERKKKNLADLNKINGQFSNEIMGSRQEVAEKSFGTAYSSIYASDPILYLNVADTEDLIKLLGNLHEREIASKENNFLFSPAHFNPDLPGVETRRGLDNISYVNGIWLDNDGGDLTHAEFAKLFPTLRVVVWNTYSSTKSQVRWRCFIPMTDVVTPGIYRVLTAQIELVLRNAGYASKAELEKHNKNSACLKKCHGFDVSKFVASSLFYAPCQAKSPDHSFFIDYNGDMRQPLNTYQLIENDIRPLQNLEFTVEMCNDIQVACMTNVNTSPAANRPLVDAALAKWRNAPKGQGNKSFFNFAVGLKRAGLSLQDIRQHLSFEVRSARSPHDRQADINGIMKTIGRSEQRNDASSSEEKHQIYA